jgi:hypothetical protein
MRLKHIKVYENGHTHTEQIETIIGYEIKQINYGIISKVVKKCQQIYNNCTVNWHPQHTFPLIIDKS